jgi:hypothetical protein
MASISNHYGDITIWIEKIINSCETPSQKLTAEKLVKQFEEQYMGIDGKLNWCLSRRLRNTLNQPL